MRTFSDYEDMRDQLLRECETIESQWRAVRSFSQRTEKFIQTTGAPQPDLVDDALDQVRSRLRSSMIEIGVFGKVKRGKSTLLNAVLGQTVSSMRVTPETAVPVWVESGMGPAEVWKLDGDVEKFDDPVQARERMGQAHRKAKPNDEIVRVVQYVNVPWLRQGIRLIDTPGLSDPSLLESYTELTYAELDRVAAAIFVIVSPPGIDAEELHILSALGTRGVDKVFIVCNFHGEQWEDDEVRHQVRTHIIDTIVRASPDGTILGDELRVFEVNAKRSLLDALENPEEPATNGVAELLEELEAYLSVGALSRQTHRCNHLLSLARDVMVDRLAQRVDSLSDPRALDARITEHRNALKDSLAEMDKIESEAETAIDRLRGQLIEILDAPFASARSAVNGAMRTRELDQLGARIRIETETAASKAATLYNREVGSIEERMKLKLFLTYGIEQRVRLKTGAVRSIESSSGGLTIDIGRGKSDWTAVAASAGTVAAAGGLAGGMLAGGIGVALIATGPIGWLIGAGIGLGLGALAGGVGAGVLTRDSIQPAQRAQLLEQVDRQRMATLDQARNACEDVERSLITGLHDQRDLYFGSQQQELNAVEALRSDETGRRTAIAEAEAMISEIRSA